MHKKIVDNAKALLILVTLIKNEFDTIFNISYTIGIVQNMKKEDFYL